MALITGLEAAEARAASERLMRAIAEKNAVDDLRAVRIALGTALATCRLLSENESLSELALSNLRSLSERIESLRPRVLLLAAEMDHTST